jgi:hypothetical protein
MDIDMDIDTDMDMDAETGQCPYGVVAEFLYPL